MFYEINPQSSISLTVRSGEQRIHRMTTPTEVDKCAAAAAKELKNPFRSLQPQSEILFCCKPTYRVGNKFYSFYNDEKSVTKIHEPVSIKLNGRNETIVPDQNHLVKYSELGAADEKTFVNPRDFAGLSRRHDGIHVIRTVRHWDGTDTYTVDDKPCEEKIVFFRTMESSNNFIPESLIDPSTLPDNIKSFNARNTGEKMYWIPKSGFRLSGEWKIHASHGCHTSYDSLPAGTWVFAGDAGNAYQCGYVFYAQ
jgi:hypothetical protein